MVMLRALSGQEDWRETVNQSSRVELLMLVAPNEVKLRSEESISAPTRSDSSSLVAPASIRSFSFFPLCLVMILGRFWMCSSPSRQLHLLDTCQPPTSDASPWRPNTQNPYHSDELHCVPILSLSEAFQPLSSRPASLILCVTNTKLSYVPSTS